MCLIAGDIVRAMSYFIFAIHSLSRGVFSTSTTMCQVSGWLAQVGTQITGKEHFHRLTCFAHSA